MKTLLAALFLAVAVPSFADPYFQHAVLTPSSIQGQLFTGVVKTNAGISQETALPVFYRNVAATAPWYDLSWSPFAIGYSAGSGQAFANFGPILDVGPQITYGIEWVASAASASFGASTKSFFNCAPSSTACGALSAGVMANGTFEQGGQLVRTWHEFGAHPVAYFLGPTILFK